MYLYGPKISFDNTIFAPAACPNNCSGSSSTVGVPNSIVETHDFCHDTDFTLSAVSLTLTQLICHNRRTATFPQAIKNY